MRCLPRGDFRKTMLSYRAGTILLPWVVVLKKETTLLRGLILDLEGFLRL
jgi:hypothetical protein